MLLVGFCTFIALWQLCLAQTPSATASAAVTTHSVSVGAEGFKFTPNEVTAAVGDVVEFQFYPQNHSVARSAFNSPCIPYEDTNPGQQGFWSGFQPVDVVLPNPPTFQIVINDTEPIFFYCSAPGSCLNHGMIGVINSNATETLEIQQDYVQNATLMLSPGESFPTETSPPGSPTPSSTSSPVAASPPGSKPALSNGAIAGIALGGGSIIFFAAALLYMCGRQRTITEILHLHQRSQPSDQPHPYTPAPQQSFSMASASTSPRKMSGTDIDPLDARRYSVPRGPYLRSEEGSESYFSSGSPIKETVGVMRMNTTVPPRANPVPARMASPSTRRSPLSDRSMRLDDVSPISPMEEAYFRAFPNIQAPPPLRLRNHMSQRMPQELSADTNQGPIPYRPQRPGYNTDLHPGNFGGNFV